MSVADEKGRRFDAATGIAAVVLWLVGFSLPGDPPNADDTPQKVASFFSDNHGAILAGDFIVCLGSVAFLWFLGSLRSYLRSAEGGAGRLSAAGFGAGAVGTALLIATMCAFSAGALKVADLGDNNLTLALYQLSALLGAGAGFGFAVLLGAASCSGARSGSLPPWLYWLGSVAALAQLLTGLAMIVDSGFFAIGEPFALLAFLVAAVWLVAVSVLMMRRDGVPPVPRTEP
jgi:hypothetical protein